MGQLYSSPVGRQPGSLYGHHLRRSFQDQGISAKNANYIIDNRSTSFQKAASTQIRKWENFCLAREVDAHNPSLNDLANYIWFLDKELQTGRGIKKYFATVEYCLSTECKSLIFNSSICSLLTIVAHNKPTIPMLPEEIWDADKVIFHFIEMPDNIALTNLQLSKKCFLLLMISLGRRNADLLALDVSQQFMKKTKDAFYCAMSKWLKGNREGKNNFMQFIEFHRFDAQPKICPYRVLQDYITRVCAPLTARAGCKNHSKLFVSTLAGTPAHRDTVACWASDMLTESRINTTQSHSVRSAVSSNCVQLKELIDSVMARCGWSKKSTFYSHYLRPVVLETKPILGPLAVPDLKPFYCPPKLLTDKSTAIPNPDFILLSDVFVSPGGELPSESEVQFLPNLEHTFPEEHESSREEGPSPVLPLLIL